MDNSGREDLIGALSEVFSILSEVFLEPEADVKVRLAGVIGRCPERCPGLDGLPGALASMVEHCGKPQHQAVEYVRLFLHGNGNATVHPYESVFTYNRLMAPECLGDLKALHESAGIRPRKGLTLPQDHLGLELEFLSYILAGFAQAEDAEEQERWRETAGVLLRRHLVPFGRQFVRKLGDARPNPYFASAGDALVEGLHACTLLLGIDMEAPAGSDH